MRWLIAATAMAVGLLGLWAETAEAVAPSPVTARYRTITRPTTIWPDRPGQTWDLTQCDLEVSYRLSMGSYRPPLGTTEWTSIGVGNHPDFLAWMSSGAPYAAEALPSSLDLDDKFNLGAPGRFDEASYDALGPDSLVSPPIGDPYANYGIWFDRTGVDPSQALLWGAVKYVTYYTRGNYQVSVSFHALGPSTGTMFARVNGVQTGFYEPGWHDGEPDFYPVGKSFDADVTSLRVFGVVQGSRVYVSSWKATGCR